jgi:hypothetical protein
LLCQPQLDRQGDQLLLRAVVDVAFELATFFVLRGDQPATGVPEILDEAGVTEHQPGLGREVVDELLLRRVHGIVGRDGSGEGAEQLPLMTDLDRRVVLERGQRLPVKRDRRRRRGVVWPHGFPSERVTDAEPYAGDGGADPRGHHLRHAR